MDFRIALAVLLGYVVLLATTNLMLRRLYALKRNAVVDDELINRSISRIIMEFVSVRILGLGSRELAKTRRLCSENTNRSAKVVATHEFFFAFFALLIIIAKIATIVLFSFGNLSLSVGGLVALLLYMDRVYNPIAILNVLYVQYKLDRVSLERLEQFLLLPNDEGLTGGGMPSDAGAFATDHRRRSRQRYQHARSRPEPVLRICGVRIPGSTRIRWHNS